MTRSTLQQQSYGVVATPNPLTADAGMEILKAGGNAIDAAVAAAFMHTVVTPDNCGVAGYAGAIVFYLADRKEVLAIDYNSRAPGSAREDLFPVEHHDDGGFRVPEKVNAHGALAVDVPGTVAGLVLAQREFGTLPLRTVLQPAIRAAREGFPVCKALAASIAGTLAANAHAFPEVYRLHTINGRPPLEGEILTNSELADTLELIAEGGSTAFYEGKIAQQIVETVQGHGGLLTLEDLAAYQARIVKPIHIQYRGHDIYTPPLSAGGLTVLQALRVLEGFDVAATGGGARLLHLLIEVAKVVFRERLTKYGDLPTAETLTEQELGDTLIEQLRQEVAVALQNPQKGRIIAPDPGTGTIHFATADAKGNVVSLTTTHGAGFGSLLAVPGTGIVLGHGMCRFDPRPGWPNSVAPHKQPLHNMAPLLALHNGRPSLALGAAGGRTILNTIYTVLTHVIDLGYSLSQALAAARFHVETMEPVWIEDGDEQITQALTELGHEVLIKPAIGTLQGIAFNQETGWAQGESDPRTLGKVVSE
ncbi:gamma-glutamyltransferase [Paenibacillus roseipurpureus]|uniref:Glutathione hydrolase proenzyme n=1 Tax=Paenibacillus roseopurpureus TaxID=2918901 RepID=A0AA96LRB4_9BACL|nr:gamma-glutamyltransferase [Paenibacillus sp. MBLB1832]WNR46832.1 gamma-glutamyltransferase [Paenibacillus sp. MBLB1832]